jgi:hypothetical protein
MFGFGKQELAVGAVGHRPNLLPEAVREDVRQRQVRVLDEIERAGRAAGFNRFVLYSALAEGADRYAARAALEKNWALECPLPFSVRRYEDDFADKNSVQEFHELKRRARAVLTAAQHDANPEAGYASVGSTIAGETSILTFVWNGDAPKGRGGTAHVAALSLAQGKPVIWIPATAGAEPKLILPNKKIRGPKDAVRMIKALKNSFPIVEAPESLRKAPPAKAG